MDSIKLVEKRNALRKRNSTDASTSRSLTDVFVLQGEHA